MYKVNKEVYNTIVSYYQNAFVQFYESWTEEEAYYITEQILNWAYNVHKLPVIGKTTFKPKTWEGLEVRHYENQWYFAVKHYKNGNSTVRHALPKNLMSDLPTKNGGTLHLNTKKIKHRDYDNFDDLDEPIQRVANDIFSRLKRTKNYAEVFANFRITKYDFDNSSVKFNYKGYWFTYDKKQKTIVYSGKEKTIEETKRYRIRLTESQLNNIIRRCINEVLQLRR